MKSKKCLECNRNAFSKGLCQLHQPKKNIKQSRINTQDNKLIKKEKRDIYFEYHLQRCTHSEESLVNIINPNKSNICHIFDKSRHKSLEDNISNCVWLLFSEHERFDKLLFSLEFDKLEKEFKCWNLVLDRIKFLLPLCKETTVFTRAIEKYLDGR